MVLTSPMNVVEKQKGGVAPLVVVIQVSEQTDLSSKDTTTPSKSAIPNSQKTETQHTLHHVTSNELFDLDNLESA